MKDILDHYFPITVTRLTPERQERFKAVVQRWTTQEVEEYLTTVDAAAEPDAYQILTTDLARRAGERSNQ